MDTKDDFTARKNTLCECVQSSDELVGELTPQGELIGTLSGVGVLQGEISLVNGGTTDHNALIHREMKNQHPIEAITDLEKTLDKKIEKIETISNMDIDRLFK